MSLQVTAVTIRDVLGARTFSMEPGGRLTILSGSNGSGKSTTLKAVQAALGRGNLMTLARVDPDGADVQPEAVVVLEGPGEAYRIERKGDKLRVRQRVGDSAAYEDVKSPQTFLASLLDTEAANPVALLTAPEKALVRLLLGHR